MSKKNERMGTPAMEREPVKINSVDWWSDDARMNAAPAPAAQDIPQGIVSEDIAPVVPESATKADEKIAYPVQPTMGPQQVAPVIQPLVIVPYVSKDQPLRYIDKAFGKNADVETEDSDGEYYYEDMYETKKVSKAAKKDTGNYSSSKSIKTAPTVSVASAPAKRVNAEPKIKTKKCKANGGAIAALIFGALYIVMLFDWSKLLSFENFVFNYNFVYNIKPGYDHIYELVEMIINGTFALALDEGLVMLLLAIGAVLVALTTLFALFTSGSRTPIFFKVIAVLGYLVQVASCVFAVFILDKPIVLADYEFGFYILAVLSLLVMICMLVANNKKTRK